MNELIDSFLELAESDSNLRIDSLLDEEEQIKWETLVKAMDGIDILQIGKDLRKISKTYQLERWQELSILAYVKLLEMMMKRVKDVDSGGNMIPKSKQQQVEYTGSMFG